MLTPTSPQLIPPLEAPKLITVGPSPPSMSGIHHPTDFQTISEALHAIPFIPQDTPSQFAYRYTILLLPGHYRERIRMKPFVNLVGISKESVYIEPLPPDEGFPEEHVLRPNTNDAIIMLSGGNNITNISILNPYWATKTNSAIRGVGIRGLGLTNIDVFPSGYWPDKVGKDGPFCRGKILELTEGWTQCIITSLGFTYLGPDDFGVSLVGKGQNADCHFISCFFDALFVDSDVSGCVKIRDCFEVHIRNSILRVHNGQYPDPNPPEVPGSAVDVFGTLGTNVYIEGCSLLCVRPSRRILNIGPNADCFFRHSCTDSIMIWHHCCTN